ncbi:chaperonin 10-like protein [Crepidotus variabilis]|uniref:alcohol dehydrogenase n=1 Tax=Crepidotus variabilis TaxID=179855 RepID=A0A9P6EGE1_9AGAR|nr:chaperonin 10-like protein [Crepidotus variabilis]
MSSTTTVEIPKVQRAAVIEELGKPYSLKTEHPVKQQQELAPGECLIKMEFAGVCHSDLHIRNGDWATKAPIPIVGGHEGIGRVVAIGDHSSGAVKVGDRVGVKWIGKVCGKCELCRTGNENCCLLTFQTSHGFKLNGTFQEYAVSFVDYVTPIPEEMDAAASTPILCAGLTVYKALKNAHLTVGQWVAISGAGGGLGHLAIQYARAMGYRVLAIDTGITKKELCLELGAEKWVDFKESNDLIADVKAATDGAGPHAAVIAAGDAKPFNQAIMYLRFTGTLVCVGMPGSDAFLQVPITLLIAKGLKIIGSSIGTQQDVTEALNLVSLGLVKCKHVIKKLEDVNEVLDDMSTGKIAGRVVLRF